MWILDYRHYRRMMSITNLVAILGVAIAATSIAIAVYQYRRTVHRDIFRVYADKYDSILQPLSCPPSSVFCISAFELPAPNFSAAQKRARQSVWKSAKSWVTRPCARSL